MNSYERLAVRLAGKPVDRAPNFNIMMQFVHQNLLAHRDALRAA